ncbi:MAG: ribonuclease HII [Bacteroidales bacterium]|nr:ribonuclease HII [Bacteroidales bacterium]
MTLLTQFSDFKFEAGCDEAGRGCLAGPVVAAAVILPPGVYHPELNDSKLLSPNKREKLRKIIEQNAVSFAVEMVDAQTIDKINILQASIFAMHKALKKLNPQPQFIIVDGNRFSSYQNIPFKAIPKGDSIYASIAAASILAKTYRDEFMISLSQKFPAYQWDKNKGYPTKNHIKAILLYGLTPYHRKTFTFKRQLKFELYETA